MSPSLRAAEAGVDHLFSFDEETLVDPSRQFARRSDSDRRGRTAISTRCSAPRRGARDAE